MTDRKQALTDLLAKVEAGDDVDTLIFLVENFKYWEGKWEYAGRVINTGSLDAAKALHDAVLPEWIVHRIRQRHGGVWEVDLMQLGADGWHDPDVSKRVNVWGDDEARTRLIAIIKALIAEETQ